MPYRNLFCTRKKRQDGFTIVELMIVIVIIMVVATTLYTFFRTSFFAYLDLQKEASALTELASKSHRVGNVVRGLTGINTASADEMVIYGYFYPTDTYVSLIRYYLSADGTKLLADVTQMTANPPIGTPIEDSLRTTTIMGNFQKTDGTDLFEYLDSSDNVLELPIADLNVIKGIRINLGVQSANSNANQAMLLEVNLRNRKTNL